MTDTLEFRSGYFGERRDFLALADLLRDVFDIDISLLDRFGGPDPSSMPFGYFDADGRCVANFSAFSMSLMVEGRIVRAAGYQSGAVRPDYRGRGLYRDLMQRAFAWSEEQGFEAGILLTDKPDLYRRYGFETVPQHLFHGPMPPVADKPDARPLSLGDDADVALATHILERRCDVSQRFAVHRATRTFLLNACFDPDIRLAHLASLDAIVAWSPAGDTLRLLDVVSPEMPSLSAISGAIGSNAKRVEILFPPDRLDWDGAAAPYRGGCDLMIRAGTARPVPSLPFMMTPAMDF